MYGSIHQLPHTHECPKILWNPKCSMVPVLNQTNQVHTAPFIYLRFILLLAYFPGVVRVFIYPNLMVICVPSLAEISHLDGIFSIITSTLLGGTLPTRRLIYIL
jgi:hypothetical protein